MNRHRSGRRLALLGVIILLGLIFASQWYANDWPSRLREWLFLRTVSNDVSREPKEFDFFVLGHLYGSPSLDDEMPARLLLRRLPDIVADEPDFMVSLGDMVYRKREVDFKNLDDMFIQKLPFPLYNTPGNHDVANNRSLYVSYFGSQTYFAKDYGPTHLIFLDTERTECGLDDLQHEMLKQEMDKAITDPKTHFIFVFMHKTLVFENSELQTLKNEQAMPNVWDCQKKKVAGPLMENIFRPAARHKPVIIFAGDVGAWGNLSPYYQRDPWLPLTLIMTGLGDTPMDNIVRVHVSSDSIHMDVLFLEDMHSAALQDFDQSYWLNISRNQ